MFYVVAPANSGLQWVMAKRAAGFIAEDFPPTVMERDIINGVIPDQPATIYEVYDFHGQLIIGTYVGEA